MTEQPTPEQVAKQELLFLQTIRHWVKLWRTAEVDSTRAMREIAALYDNAGKKYD